MTDLLDVGDVLGRWNAGCLCVTLDREALAAALDAEAGEPGFGAALAQSHPQLFAAAPLFVSRGTLERIEALVGAVEAAVATPGYREAVLARAPAIARLDHGPQGVFMGFDLHLAEDGPKLIEINTNAGGALLNAVLARAQRACCEEMAGFRTGPVALEEHEAAIVAMFEQEWRAGRGGGRPRRIAIVDDAPASQHLLPEFRLFRRLFERHGFEALIADAADLEHRRGALRHDGARIDLVYNRLVDFALAAPGHAALRAAYEAGDAVVTPHPRAHALYADKRNLALLGDPARLRAQGVSEGAIAVLEAAVPRTEIVVPEAADRLWAERRRLFFKPAAGHGSKAAYRGDKLTRATFAAIIEGGYVAQALVAPSARGVLVDGVPSQLKVDLRAYAHAGRVQMLAARLYRGQTTNMRTQGGGFAPVLLPPRGAEPGAGDPSVAAASARPRAAAGGAPGAGR